MIFDAHAHYDDHQFDPDREAILASMKENDVHYIVNVGVDIATSKASIALAKKYDFIYAAIGIYPHETKDITDNTLAQIADLAREKKVVAIGEIGLDYHWDTVAHDTQKYWFQKQLKLANEVRLPIVIHDRDAHGDTMALLKKTPPKMGGILHSFSGSYEMAKEVLALGMDLSISGPLTYKNNRKTIEVVEKVPIDHLLIETDSPYLPPEPHRGERNSSLYVKYVAQKIADIKKMAWEDVCRITCENAKRVYRIK